MCKSNYNSEVKCFFSTSQCCCPTNIKYFSTQESYSFYCCLRKMVVLHPCCPFLMNWIDVTTRPVVQKLYFEWNFIHGGRFFLWFHVLHSNLFSIAPTHADARRVLLGQSRCERMRTDAMLSHSANERWRWGGTEDLMLSVCGLRDWVVERCWNTSLRGYVWVCVWWLPVGEQSSSAKEEEGSDVSLPKTAARETEEGVTSVHVRGQETVRGRTPWETLRGRLWIGRECVEKVWETWFCVGTGH